MSTEVAKTTQAGVSTKDLSASERFTMAVMKEFTTNAGDIQVTNFQKKLCQNYFIKLDAVLKEAERKRLLKSEKNRDPIPVTWENVNMQKLAVDVMAFSSIGLDPVQKNQINLVPFKNNGTNKYDINFLIGYKGLELKAKKYGFEIPDDVIVELVYSNDKFKSIKKNATQRVESYEFEITDDFERGEIKGGFYYHVFFDKPEKNKLRTFSLNAIQKRIPKYASAEFWGGEKDVWENNKKVGTEKVEGWFDEMCYKTIFRAAFDEITIDSEKIDDHLIRMLEAENQPMPEDDQTKVDVKNQITSRANKQSLSIEDTSYEEVKEQPETKAEEPEPPKQPEPKQEAKQGSKEPAEQEELDF